MQTNKDVKSYYANLKCHFNITRRLYTGCLNRFDESPNYGQAINIKVDLPVKLTIGHIHGRKSAGPAKIVTTGTCLLAFPES